MGQCFCRNSKVSPVFEQGKGGPGSNGQTEDKAHMPGETSTSAGKFAAHTMSLSKV